MRNRRGRRRQGGEDERRARHGGREVRVSVREEGRGWLLMKALLPYVSRLMGWIDRVMVITRAGDRLGGFGESVR